MKPNENNIQTYAANYKDRLAHLRWEMIMVSPQRLIWADLNWSVC